MIFALIILALWLFFLWYSADHLVNSSVRIAKFFKVSTALIWLTIVSFWTSAPELFLSAMSALSGKWNLSVWNVIGSNIFNLWFILWLAAIVYPIVIRRKIFRRDFMFLLFITSLILFMVRDNHVGLWEWVALLSILIWYTVYLRAKKDVPEWEIEEAKEDLKESKHEALQWKYFLIVSLIMVVLSSFKAEWVDWKFVFDWGFSVFMKWSILVILLLAVWYYVYSKWIRPEIKKNWLFLSFLLLIVSLITLILSSDHVVNASVFLAQLWWMSERAIWATIIAMWTSLPELAVTITSLLKKDYWLSVWNLIGSDIFNILWIIWISSTITPLNLKTTCIVGDCEWFRWVLWNDIQFSLVLLLVTLFITAICMRTWWKISRREWIIIFSIAILRMVFEFKPDFFIWLF